MMGEVLSKFDAYDRPLSDKLVLLALVDLEEATREELAEHCGLAYSTVTTSLDDLSHLIEVETTYDIKDGRRTADVIRLREPP